MAHEVSLELNEKVVLHKDVKVEAYEVKVDTENKRKKTKLGTLLISKGNIEWLPSGNSVNKHRLTWRQLAEIFEEHGKAVRITK